MGLWPSRRGVVCDVGATVVVRHQNLWCRSITSAVSDVGARMAALLATVEATLRGKDERLVAKCDVPGSPELQRPTQ